MSLCILLFVYYISCSNFGEKMKILRTELGAHLRNITRGLMLFTSSPVVETRPIHLGRNKMKQANFKEFYT